MPIIMVELCLGIQGVMCVYQSLYVVLITLYKWHDIIKPVLNKLYLLEINSYTKTYTLSYFLEHSAHNI